VVCGFAHVRADSGHERAWGIGRQQLWNDWN
jgi:hypothetical protein